MDGLIKARDRQDRAALEKIVGDTAQRGRATTQGCGLAIPAGAQAESYAAEVAIEVRDKLASQKRRASRHRCGREGRGPEAGLVPNTSAFWERCAARSSPATRSAAIKYGKCALEAVNKAIELDPKASINYVSHGVGNYYLPPAFGGGMDLAIKDFRKAIELNPKNEDAWLWLGIALRRSNQPEEARKAIAKSLELNPDRAWAKQQFAKTTGP